MAEKEKGTRSPRRRGGAEKKMTESRQKAEHDVGALDNPDVADEPSELRHLAYFGVVVGFAFVLNIVVLVLAANGR